MRVKIIVKKPSKYQKVNAVPLIFTIAHREAAMWVFDQLMTSHITDSAELFQKSPYKMPEVSDAIHGLKREGYIKTDYLIDKEAGRVEEWTLCPNPQASNSKPPVPEAMQSIKFIRFASRKGINVMAADPKLSLTAKGLFTYMWNVAAEQDIATKASICDAHAEADRQDFEAALENLQCEGYLKIESDHNLKDGSEVTTWILKQEPKNHRPGE